MDEYCLYCGMSISDVDKMSCDLCCADICVFCHTMTETVDIICETCYDTEIDREE
jgi:hypothetical protein